MRWLKILLVISLFLVACSSTTMEPEYKEEKFENALNEGNDLTGAIVSFEVRELILDNAFEYKGNLILTYRYN